MPQPQYSPYLAPSDFWLFPRPKIGLRYQRFAAVDITRSAKSGLRATPKEICRECYHSWQILWEQVCVSVCLVYCKQRDVAESRHKNRDSDIYKKLLNSDWLRAGRSGIESRWGRDFPPVQTGPGARPASCKMGPGFFQGVKCGPGVLLTTHPLLVPRSWMSRAIPLPTLWATPAGPGTGSLC